MAQAWPHHLPYLHTCACCRLARYGRSAGLWDYWKQPDGRYLESFALVTTEPNELVSTIHDRLALILKSRDYDRWLITEDKDDPRLPLDLLRPLDSDEMKMVPANPAVGNWRNNGPEMLNSV